MNETLLHVRNLEVSYRISRGPLRRPTAFKAVNGVDIQVGAGECVALIGESGSGKSTLGKGILGLAPVTSGSVIFHGRELVGARSSVLRAVRRGVQMVFQDPYSSLNPLMPVGESIAEPLAVHTSMTAAEREREVGDLLVRVGLDPEHAHRYPAQFSGGQRQRVSIARAIALNPRLVVCDEPLSALDVATQNQIINLLQGLQREREIAYLFISHDLAVSRHIADRIVVLYLGRVVEAGPAERVLSEPAHPYTRALLAADLVPDPAVQRARVHQPVVGEIPDPMNPPPGCPFVTRCPDAMQVCHSAVPPTTRIDDGGTVACYLQTEGPRLAGQTLPAEV